MGSFRDHRMKVQFLVEETEELSSDESVNSSKKNPTKHRWDVEEYFFLAYLSTKELYTCQHWKDRKEEFEKAFPKGELRRCRGEGLSTRYGGRSITGMQCEYYRFRDQSAMSHVRDENRIRGQAAIEKVKDLGRRSYAQFSNEFMKHVSDMLQWSDGQSLEQFLWGGGGRRTSGYL